LYSEVLKYTLKVDCKEVTPRCLGSEQINNIEVLAISYIVDPIIILQ